MKSKCNLADCNRMTFARGLCRRCYASAYMWVKKGRTTWKELEKEGISFPREKHHPKARAPLTKALQLVEKMRKVETKNEMRAVFIGKKKEGV